MTSVKQETLSGMKWSTIERFSVQGVNFLLGIIMARILTPSDYGTVGMLAIFLAVSNSFVDSGFSNALIRKLNRTEVDFSTVFYFNILISLVCYSLLFASAPYISNFFNLPILCPLLRVQSLSLIFNSLMVVHVAKLTIELNFKALAKRAFWATIISGVIGLICAYIGMGVWSLVIQHLSYVLVNLIFVWMYLRWKPLPVFSVNSFKELFSYGSKLLVSGLLHTVYQHMTTFIIGKFFSSKELGFYNRGTQFATMPIDTMNAILGKVTFPILVKLQNDDAHLISVYRKYICITSMIIFFGCSLLAALAKPLILLLLTDKWADSIIYLQIFSFAIMFDHICSINLKLLQVKGRSDLFLRLEVIKKLIAVLILFASIPFGVIGICVSKIIYTQIAVFINTYYTGKLFGMGYFTQLKDFVGFFILSVICCLPSYLLSSLYNMPNWLIIVLGLVISCFLYYICLQNNVYMKEIVAAVKSKIYLKRK